MDRADPRQIPHPDDTGAPPAADTTNVKRRLSTPSPCENRAPRACVLGAAALAAAALPSSAAAAPGSGVGSLVWLLAAVGAAVLVFALMRLRAGLPGGHRITDIADGRELLIARGRRITEELTERTDAVAERDDEGATRQQQRAFDVVASARSRIGRASGQRVQAKAHQELDEAEWLIGVLRARLDGFVEPLAAPPRPAGDVLLRRRARSRDGRDRPRGRRPAARSRALVRSLRRRPRARRAATRRLDLDRRAFGALARRPRWCGSYAWAAKDLKHLRYDGTPLFAEPERPAARKRQTVAERARSVRSRVLPVAPEVLPDDEADEIPDDFEAYADAAGELPADEPQDESAAYSAFAAMEGETPASYRARRSRAATRSRSRARRRLGAGPSPRRGSHSMRAVSNALLWPVRFIGALLPDGWAGLARQLAVFSRSISPTSSRAHSHREARAPRCSMRATSWALRRHSASITSSRCSAGRSTPRASSWTSLGSRTSNASSRSRSRS